MFNEYPYALYRWKEAAKPEQISQALKDVEALALSVPGIFDIMTGENTSQYSEGCTYVILVRGETQAAINTYSHHPDHVKVAGVIESMEDRGIGVDFISDQPSLTEGSS